MIKIYCDIEELPRGIKETLMMQRKLDLSKIDYTIVPEYGKSIPDELRQKAIAIPTITENWIYVVMKGE